MQDWYDFGIKDASNGNPIMLPSFLQGDLGYTPAYEGENATSRAANFGPTGAGGRDYGLFNGMNSLSNNFQTIYDPNDPNNFKLRIKVGDKAGTEVPYTLQDGRWVPQQQGASNFNWNSNPTWQNYMPLAIMAAPFGASAAGLGGAAGGGAAAADGITMLPASNLFEGATLAANAPTSVLGGAAGGISMAPASNLFEGASMAPNAPTSISQAATGAAAGGSLLDKVPAALKNPSTLSSLAKLGGLLAGGALGGAGSEQGQGQTAVAQPIPTMYGGGSSGLLGWGPMGNTETEKRMRTQYLPGLLGGQNPWGY